MSEAPVINELAGIGHVVLREGDVVRHDLVRRIVRAYEADAETMRRSAP